MKLTRKRLHSLEQGCQMGWLIDPAEQIVLVYASAQTPQDFDLPEDVLPMPSFVPAPDLTHGQLFGWL